MTRLKVGDKTRVSFRVLWDYGREQHFQSEIAEVIDIIDRGDYKEVITTDIRGKNGNQES